MTNIQVLKNIVEGNNGYIKTSDATALGINRNVFSDFVKNGFEKVCKGFYRSDTAWIDSLYELSVQYPVRVFSHESALSIHGLMERDPFEETVTVPYGYNATGIREKNVNVYSIKKEWYSAGVIKKETFFGNEVNVYDMDRTICDIIRSKKNIDSQVFSYALKEYAKRKDKNLVNLSKYALMFNCTKELQVYMEVLL